MKMKFGALVVAGSGKIGGHVASKNRGGAYLRTKTTPNNPQTADQQNQRAQLGALSTAWSQLTDAERKSFDSRVADFKSTDIFGDIRNPSGINLFVKLNVNLGNIGETYITSCPEKVENYSAVMTEAVCQPSDDSFTIEFNDAALNGKIVLVYATPSLSPGTAFVKNKLRLIGFKTVASEQVQIWDEYTAKFGIPAISANIVIACREVALTGQAGVISTVKASVIPPA